MKRILFLAFILYISLNKCLNAKNDDNKYVIAVRNNVAKEHEWMEVVKCLERNHQSATIVIYQDYLSELLPRLRALKPRYVCVVDKPENINRDFVIEGNRMCRNINDGIYDDYIWGIITSYSAKDALRIAEQSAKPFVVKSALASTSELKSGVWFDELVYLDDGIKGNWGEKTKSGGSVNTFKTSKLFKLLPIFRNKWAEIDPDIIITSSHATQKNLEMPFSSGNIKSKNGNLYADFIHPQTMPPTQKPRVYFPVGNCLIGDMNNSRESMAAAWLSSGGATAMLAYVVPTWHGRSGWGALKFWTSAPGKQTLAQAAFLNRQDMLTQQKRKNPQFLTINPDFKTYGNDNVRNKIENKVKHYSPNNSDQDDIGFIYDRDVLVYYGDPAWDVKLKNIPEYDGYCFDLKIKGKKHIITLKTNPSFSIEKVNGKGFKEEHVGDIPIAYFFPVRINNPKLIENKDNLDCVFDENFLLIYDKDIVPNKEYKIILTQYK